ncbi:MFS transporter [Amycolatopsis alba]|uniref:MFS transporter n=1 Tax=Amycolatopsis alba DSM 44262 TaxID=1125972 RepID=A0A229S9K3_AMYAL|nr:MFS transporter [Amycolatopsis alba]OXM55607.1 MFS transporter [Amycolatopsis alba DSM 44262]
MTRPQTLSPHSTTSDRLPLAALLALATTGFITLLTETMPAGVLPAMSRDLGVSESAAGQSVTVFAIGAILAAIPLTKATIGWPRRHLLLVAISGFAVANTVTALSGSFALTLAARFIAGIVGGLLWALLAGYAVRMVPAHQRGKAMAIAMAGATVALSIGVPAAALLAKLIEWRYAFGIMTVLTLALIVWVVVAVPNFPGQPKGSRLPLTRTFRIPGVAPVLVVTLTFVLSHSILYTYIAPFLAPLGMESQVDAVLLTFGLVSLVSIWITGALIHRNLRLLMILACALFAACTLLLGIFSGVPALVYAGAALWGLAFGGTSTLLQTAVAEAAGDAGDVAQALLTTGWNIGIAGGGIIGGIILGGLNASWLSWVALALLVPTLAIVITARKNGFIKGELGSR